MPQQQYTAIRIFKALSIFFFHYYYYNIKWDKQADKINYFDKNFTSGHAKIFNISYKNILKNFKFWQLFQHFAKTNP